MKGVRKRLVDYGKSCRTCWGQWVGKNIPIGGTSQQAGTLLFSTDPANTVRDLDNKAHAVDNFYATDARFFFNRRGQSDADNHCQGFAGCPPCQRSTGSMGAYPIGQRRCKSRRRNRSLRFSASQLQNCRAFELRYFASVPRSIVCHRPSTECGLMSNMQSGSTIR